MAKKAAKPTKKPPKAKAPRRSARKAPRRSPRHSPPAGPVRLQDKALGRVVQIIVAKGDKTYLHTFKDAPELFAATAAGVLVIRGRFSVNPAGFIVG